MFDDGSEPVQGLTRSASVAPAASQDMLQDMLCLIWVDTQSRIVDCSEHVLPMFGYRRDELNGRSLHELLPGLDESVLLRDGRINPEVAFHCRCGMPFQVVDRVGREIACNLFMNEIGNAAGLAITIITIRSVA